VAEPPSPTPTPEEAPADIAAKGASPEPQDEVPEETALAAATEAVPPEASEVDATALETETVDDSGTEPTDGGASKSPAPLTRSDYVSATGAGRTMRVMQQNMTARGTTDTQGSRQLEKKPGQKSKTPEGPRVAALSDFKAPVSKQAKQEEQKAQKPDIRLTPADALKSSSPLAGHLRKNSENKSKKGGNDEGTDERKEAARRAGSGGGGGGERQAGSGLEESRAQRRDKRKVTPSEEEGAGPRFPARKRKGSKPQIINKTSAEIELPITVRSLSEALGRPSKTLMQTLWSTGQMVTINSALTEEEALDLAIECGIELHIVKEKDLEDELKDSFEEADPPETLVARPPIVTILGHVDHGKTTLVDKIRSANVAASEHGGITQHIAAYQVDHNGNKITFVDTPGHAAFGEMRARGANVTDIIVLVVAANDGVMPQTVECIAHAKAAGVPMIVALNKCDLPDRNEQRVMQDLAQHNVLVAEWGGDVEMERTSGLTGLGVSDLLDTLLLTAELHEYSTNPSRPACGVCLEAFRDEGRGPIAWLIDQKGTLSVGDVVICGEAYGRIRAMYNDRNEEVQHAGPSLPIKVAGLDMVPRAGDRFLAVDDIDLVRQIAEERRQRGRQQTLASTTSKRTLEDILNAARDGEVQDLHLIVKADTPGSLEALQHEIKKFEHPEVRVKILHQGVGGVNESDVYLASASEAVIIAFHVIAEDRAEQLASQEEVEIRRYNIIYEVIDEIRTTLEGMLRPEKKQVTTGRAIVLRVFSIGRTVIAGCRVLNGTIERSSRVHLIREQKVLNDYSIGSLRREKDDAKEVREGMECGIRLDGYNDIKEGDLLEAFKIEEIARKFD
jgi:translation initiation factor IF-2